MFEARKRILRTFAVPGPNVTGLHTVIRSYSAEPVRIDEANYPADSCPHGIVITGLAAAFASSEPAIAIDSVYAASVPVTLINLEVCHGGIALKIEGEASCTLHVEGSVSLAGSVGIQGGSGKLTLESAAEATLRGVGVYGEGFETAVSFMPPSAVFPGSLTLAGDGSFEFAAYGPFAGIRCPEGTLALEGASMLTVSGGCSGSGDCICGPGGAGIYARNLVVTTTHPVGLTSIGGSAELHEGGCGIVAQNVIADGRIIACGGKGRIGGDGCWLQALGEGKIGGRGDVILQGGEGTIGARGCGLWIQNSPGGPVGREKDA